MQITIFSKYVSRTILKRSTYFGVYREDCTNGWFLVYGDDCKVQDIIVDNKAGRILSGGFIPGMHQLLKRLLALLTKLRKW